MCAPAPPKYVIYRKCQHNRWEAISTLLKECISSSEFTSYILLTDIVRILAFMRLTSIQYGGCCFSSSAQCKDPRMNVVEIMSMHPRFAPHWRRPDHAFRACILVDLGSGDMDQSLLDSVIGPIASTPGSRVFLLEEHAAYVTRLSKISLEQAILEDLRFSDPEEDDG